MAATGAPASGDPAQGIGVEAVLDPIQAFDQGRIADGVTDPETRQAPRLGKSVCK